MVSVRMVRYLYSVIILIDIVQIFRDKGLEIFQKQIMSSSAGDIKKKTMNGLIALIRRER